MDNELSVVLKSIFSFFLGICTSILAIAGYQIIFILSGFDGLSIKDVKRRGALLAEYHVEGDSFQVRDGRYMFFREIWLQRSWVAKGFLSSGTDINYKSKTASLILKVPQELLDVGQDRDGFVHRFVNQETETPNWEMSGTQFFFVSKYHTITLRWEIAFPPPDTINLFYVATTDTTERDRHPAKWKSKVVLDTVRLLRVNRP